MRDLRMKIAAFAIALGLGGLGGYAVSSSKTPQATTATLAQGTKVIRRTVHAKRPKAKATRHSHAAAGHALASTPVSTGSSGAGYLGSSSSRPVSTGTSGSSGPPVGVVTGRCTPAPAAPPEAAPVIRPSQPARAAAVLVVAGAKATAAESTRAATERRFSPGLEAFPNLSPAFPGRLTVATQNGSTSTTKEQMR